MTTPTHAPADSPMTRLLATTLVLSIAALAGCKGDIATAPHALAEQVEILELETTSNGAKAFELSITGDDRYLYSDHLMAMVMTFGPDRCDGNGYSIDPGSGPFELGDAHPKAGQPIVLQITCQRGLMPHHRSVAADTLMTEVFDPVEGKTRSASSRFDPAAEPPVQVANRLLGDFLRKAYTEDCAEGPLVVERVETALETGEPPQMHGRLVFRCLEAEPANDS